MCELIIKFSQTGGLVSMLGDGSNPSAHKKKDRNIGTLIWVDERALVKWKKKK